MDDLTYNGIVLAPIIVGLVTLLKHYGMPAKFAPLANGLLSIGALALVQTAQGWAGVNVADFAINAIVLFVATAGVYDLGQFGLKQVKKKNGALPVKNEGDKDAHQV